MLRTPWALRIAGALFLGSLACVPRAWAVPSFARQTGMTCEACHTVFPELNHFGRMFKANAYTLDNLNQVRGITPQKQEMLDLSGLPPLSVMVQISDTQLSKALPDGTGGAGHSQTSTVGFPQQLSIFYAGKIAPHLGAMIQLTYADDSGTIGIDNTDVRFANNIILPQETNLVYGVSLNNNPTVQDLWNSTPAWGYPYSATNASVSPLAGTEIDGTLAQDVAGLTVYAMWNEQLYAELGLYRSAKQGVTNPITGAAGPLDGTVSNVIKQSGAPYFRVAYEYNWSRNSLEAGVYGANFKLYPGGGTTTSPALLSGPVNEFQDVAEDFQYQFLADEHFFSLTGTRIHETMSLDASYAAGASANLRNTLTTFRTNANYYFRRKYGGTLAYFQTTGSIDNLLYPATPAPGVITSANGNPETRGWMAELNYLPWLNTKLTLQYTSYSKFNGGSINYDGFNRNASNNDVLYLLLWVAF
jgi:hypothetical protein